MLRTVSQSASSIWMARLSARTPALLTSASTGPSERLLGLREEVVDGAVGDVAGSTAAVPPASSMALTVALAPASSER